MFYSTKQRLEEARSGMEGTVRNLLICLSGALTQYDRQQSRRAAKAGRRHNIYALSHYLEAKQNMEKELQNVLDSSDDKAVKAFLKSLQDHFIRHGQRGGMYSRGSADSVPEGGEDKYVISSINRVAKMAREWMRSKKPLKYPTSRIREELEEERDICPARDDAQPHTAKSENVVDRIHQFLNSKELLEAGQAPGKLEVDSIKPEQAREYAEEKFKAAGRSVEEELPDLSENFRRVQKLTKLGKTQRKDMPVIEMKDVRDLQNRLKNGRLDVEPPRAKENKGNPFPEGLSGADAKKWLEYGIKDGVKADDITKVEMRQIPVGRLKPIQRQIYYDKSMDATAKFGAKGTEKFLKSQILIASADNFIIDGHHRWLSGNLIDPQMKLPVLVIHLPISKLLPLTLSYGDAIGNKRNQ